MPTPKMKRDVILKTSVAAGSAADLTISMDASFSTTVNGTTITYEDESSSSAEEKTKYKLVFANVGGATIGTMTVKFVGNPDPSSGASVALVRAGYDFDPAGTQGNVNIITAPTHSFERIWKQAVLSGSTEIVDNVAKIDIRVTAGSGITVTQTLDTAKDNTLKVNYSWSDPAVGAVASGSVTFGSSVSAGTGYTTGPIRITDTDSTESSLRRVAAEPPRRGR